MENNSDICGIVSSIVLDCFLVHHKNKNFGAYTQILDTIIGDNANAQVTIDGNVFAASFAMENLLVSYRSAKQPLSLSFTSLIAVVVGENCKCFG